MTKAQFKELYSNGGLLWVATLFNTPLSKVQDELNKKLATGINISDYARNVSGNDKNNVNGVNNSLEYDEANNVVYVNLVNCSGNTVIVYTLA
jgi:hypothetical protein